MFEGNLVDCMVQTVGHGDNMLNLSFLTSSNFLEGEEYVIFE